MTSTVQSRAHRLRLMSGRDPYEEHRAATPLELLYDLTFVVAFGVAGEQFAHLLAEGHFAAGLSRLRYRSLRGLLVLDQLLLVRLGLRHR